MKGKLYEKKSDNILSTDNKWHGECVISGYAGTSYQSEWQELQEYHPNRARRTEIVSPLITSKWGQSVSNDGSDTHAYNYYVTESSNSCEYCPACATLHCKSMICKVE